MERANLGLATTRELLNELRTRLEIADQLDYRPVDEEPTATPNRPIGSLNATPREPVGPDNAPDDPAEMAGVEEVAPKRVLPEGKRVVRTKSSGDRVYLLDDVKKTRQWITKPEILDGLGFTMADVTEVEDTELLKFNMGPALYKVDNGPAPQA